MEQPLPSSSQNDAQPAGKMKHPQPDEKSASVYLSGTDDDGDEILVPYQPRASPRVESNLPTEQDLYGDHNTQETPAVPALTVPVKSNAPSNPLRFPRGFPDGVSECSMVFTDSEAEADNPRPENRNSPDEPENPPSASPSVDSGNENPAFESTPEMETSDDKTSDASSARKIKIEGFDDDDDRITPITKAYNNDTDLPIFVPQQSHPGSDSEDDKASKKSLTFEEMYVARKEAEALRTVTVNASRRRDWEAFGDYDDSDSDADEMLAKIPGGGDGDADSIPPHQQHFNPGFVCCPCSTWCVERKLNKGRGSTIKVPPC
jgi:hypothetical protein